MNEQNNNAAIDQRRVIDESSDLWLRKLALKEAVNLYTGRQEFMGASNTVDAAEKFYQFLKGSATEKALQANELSFSKHVFNEAIDKISKALQEEFSSKMTEAKQAMEEMSELPLQVFNSNKQAIFRKVEAVKNNDLYYQIEAFLLLNCFKVTSRHIAHTTMRCQLNNNDCIRFLMTGTNTKSNVVHINCDLEKDGSMEAVFSATTFDSIDSFVSLFYANEYLSRLTIIEL